MVKIKNKKKHQIEVNSKVNKVIKKVEDKNKAISKVKNDNNKANKAKAALKIKKGDDNNIISKVKKLREHKLNKVIAYASKKVHCEFDGFKVLEWKYSEESTILHHFFIKAHVNVTEEKNQRKPAGKTLCVINIPSFITKENLKDVFTAFGGIKNIYIHQNPTTNIPEEDDPYFPQYKNQIYGYKVAYIVFKSPRSVSTILHRKHPPHEEPLVISNATKIQSGLNKWIHEYNSQIIESSVLENHAKTFMEKFDKSELKRKREEELNEGQPDDDGWVTVTRSGPRSGIRRTEQTEERLKEKKRRSEKQLLNFTQGQIKETRAKQLADLKKKFDEDKQRVAMMKNQRKFRPFTT